MFTKLDFSEMFIKELKNALNGEPRKNHRKPQTPSKIQKEEVNPINSQSTRYISGKKSVPKTKPIQDSQIQTDLSIPSVLGKR